MEDPKKRDTPLKFSERIDGGGLPAPCAAWTLPECSDTSSKYGELFVTNIRINFEKFMDVLISDVCLSI